MAATTYIYRYTGASGSPTTTDITASTNRISTSDSPTPGASYAIPRPGSGVIRSYAAAVALYATVAPAGAINNIKFYTDGTNANTGATLYVGETNTYAQAAGTEGAFGDDSAVATTDAFTYTQASPLAVTSNSTTGTGRLSYLLVFQVDIANNANPGAASAETMTISYDES